MSCQRGPSHVDGPRFFCACTLAAIGKTQTIHAWETIPQGRRNAIAADSTQRHVNLLVFCNRATPQEFALSL